MGNEYTKEGRYTETKEYYVLLRELRFINRYLSFNSPHSPEVIKASQKLDEYVLKVMRNAGKRITSEKKDNR
ncbi:MAG: hypothetical protein PWR10_2233 [Halanaerobiales bacterium]|nr:hypothetical protein [Halanaerobiales bacterium]